MKSAAVMTVTLVLILTSNSCAFDSPYVMAQDTLGSGYTTTPAQPVQKGLIQIVISRRCDVRLDPVPLIQESGLGVPDPTDSNIEKEMLPWLVGTFRF